ncbi:MAG: dihydrolipoyl dehydrogenase [Candidatus Edwardsbacteria bacterium]
MNRLIIIGAGPAGYVAAIRAAQLGAEVILVEKEEVGGTCLNVGCIPTKSLLSSAKIFHEFKRAEHFGLKAENISFDFSQIQQRKERVVRRLVAGVKQLLKSRKVEIKNGQAQFLDANTIELQKPDRTLERLEGEKILIATGSKNIRLPIEEIDCKGVIDSTTALSLNEIPKRFLIIGGGAIGIEMAYIYHTFGSEVTIVEMMPQILPAEDRDIAEELQKIMTKQGIEILTQSTVEKIERKPEGLEVTINYQLSTINSKLVDKVLVSVGRKANIEELGLEKIGIVLEKGYIKVNEKMETSIPHIYAAGDCIGGWLLAHVASMEGEVVVENTLGLPSVMDYSAVPRCVYSFPEIASVGLTERMALEKNHKIKIGKFPFSANGKALAGGESEGFVKVVAEEGSEKILGASIIGAQAVELIAEFSIAIKMRARLNDIIETMHAHPALHEASREAVLATAGRTIHLPG